MHLRHFVATLGQQFDLAIVALVGPSLYGRDFVHMVFLVEDWTILTDCASLLKSKFVTLTRRRLRNKVEFMKNLVYKRIFV